MTIAFNFARRGLFRRLLAVVAAPILPRTANSAVDDCDPHLVATYSYDSKGRVISATQTLYDEITSLSNY
jgi:hypothetical protein